MDSYFSHYKLDNIPDLSPLIDEQLSWELFFTPHANEERISSKTYYSSKHKKSKMLCNMIADSIRLMNWFWYYERMNMNESSNSIYDRTRKHNFLHVIFEIHAMLPLIRPELFIKKKSWNVMRSDWLIRF